MKDKREKELAAENKKLKNELKNCQRDLSQQCQTVSDAESIQSHILDKFGNKIDLSFVEFNKQGNMSSFTWNGLLENTRDKKYEKITMQGTIHVTLIKRLG